MEIGVDISRWQCPVNWEKMAQAKPAFAAVRATIGNIYIDPFFVDSFAKFKLLKIPVTAYHVIRPDVDGTLQAEWFMKALGEHTTELPLVLDCELGDAAQGTRIAQIIFDAMTWLRGKGKEVMIYSRKTWVDSVIVRVVGKKKWLNEVDWWLAWYPTDNTNLTKPKPPEGVDAARVKIHQYRDNGEGADYGTASKEIDLNRWIGTEQLADYLKVNTVPNPASYVLPYPGSSTHAPTVEERLANLEYAAKWHGWKI